MPVTFLAPIVFVAVEALVPYVFDWYLALTQAWVTPIIQIAELTGPLGVSFLIMLCNAMLYDFVDARRRGAAWPRGAVLAAAAVLIACTAFGFARINHVRSAREAAAKFTVGVVQANVGIVRKRRAEEAHNRLTQHQELSAALQQAGADVILWSETSYPYTFRREQSRDWSPGHPRRARQGFDRPLVFGALTAGSGSRSAYNSAMLLDEHDRVRGRFDKNILIAFGEYIPFYEQLPVIRRWLPAANNLARGTDVALLSFESNAGVVNIAPMICYEDIFPSFGRRIARLRPNLLVNLTNDAWFGDTSLPWLHLASSVFRAVEHAARPRARRQHRRVRVRRFDRPRLRQNLVPSIRMTRRMSFPIRCSKPSPFSRHKPSTPRWASGLAAAASSRPSSSTSGCAVAKAPRCAGTW